MRKRSKYRPKTPPGFMTIPAMFRYSQQEETALQLVPHSELDKFRHGLGDEVAWNTLAFRLNWGYVMADEFGDEPRAVMVEGLNAIRAIRERNERLQKWGCTGDEFFAIGEALNLTDEMQQKTTRKEQLDAIRKTLSVSEYKKTLNKITQ